MSKPIYALDPDDPLPTAARAALLGRLGAVSGVTPGAVGVIRRDATGTLLRVTFIGWSPSLHSVDCEIEAFSHRQPDDERLHRIPPEAFEAAVAMQERRLAAGIELGLHRPIDVPRASFAGIATRHLLSARALVDLVNAEGGDYGEEIQEDLVNLHRGDGAEGNAAILTDDVCWAMETGAGRVCGKTVAIGANPPGRWVTFDGVTLSMGGREIAETAATLLEGRPLRDLATVHPALDGCVITSVATLLEDGHPELRVTLEPELVPVPPPGGSPPTR